jgi:hypothetical protein
MISSRLRSRIRDAPVERRQVRHGAADLKESRSTTAQTAQSHQLFMSILFDMRVFDLSHELPLTIS